jgi:hypothetical protein
MGKEAFVCFLMGFYPSHTKHELISAAQKVSLSFMVHAISSEREESCASEKKCLQHDDDGGEGKKRCQSFDKRLMLKCN